MHRNGMLIKTLLICRSPLDLKIIAHLNDQLNFDRELHIQVD